MVPNLAFWAASAASAAPISAGGTVSNTLTVSSTLAVVAGTVLLVGTIPVLGFGYSAISFSPMLARMTAVAGIGGEPHAQSRSGTGPQLPRRRALGVWLKPQ